MTDIIGEIDALIDEQLTTGEPRTGYGFGDPQYPKCPHCTRNWHGLPLTERIAMMYAAGRFDETYRVDTDDSRVLCRGSDFIGPMPRESDWEWVPSLGLSVSVGVEAPDWIRDLIQATTEYVGEQLGAIRGYQGWGIQAGGSSDGFWSFTMPATHFRDIRESAPHIGGTWEPITAPGVTEYPEGQ